MTATLIAFALKHWRLGAAAALVLAAVLAGSLLAHRLDRPALARAKAQAAAAQAAEAGARAQVELDRTAAAAVETARTTETHATKRAGAAADAITRLPHAKDALDADVLSEWARDVDGLRDDAARAHAPADAPRGAGAARPVPPGLTGPTPPR